MFSIPVLAAQGMLNFGVTLIVILFVLMLAAFGTESTADIIVRPPPPSLGPP